MSDILKQIQALQEQFSNLLEDSVKKAERRNLDKSIKADHKEAKRLKKKISDCWTRHSCYLFPSVQSEKINDERIGYVRKLKKLIADGNQKLQKRDELNKEEAMKAGKESKATNKSETHKFSLTNEEFVQQVLILKEAFSNLFEVDGLGQPAVDVPPSQNKIKKDRKTKDGKVEVVSVEDELFPYEGDKREQYRQKIIDTINAMIQGTATLEDLLQITRQKKAPLKEAMELMEALIYEYTEEDRKEAAKKVLPQRKAEFEKAYKEFQKVHDKIDPERILNYKLTPVEQYKANKTATKLERAQDRLNHAEEVAGNVEKTPHGTKIKEALNILSELFDRPDLLNDIDNTLGSPVKKTVKKVLTPKKTIREAIEIMEELLNESNPEAIQNVANKRAYDAGYHSQKQFNNGEVTPEGKRAYRKFAKIKELLRKRENRTGEWAVKYSELADNCNKGWEDSKKVGK